MWAASWDACCGCSRDLYKCLACSRHVVPCCFQVWLESWWLCEGRCTMLCYYYTTVDTRFSTGLSQSLSFTASSSASRTPCTAMRIPTYRPQSASSHQLHQQRLLPGYPGAATLPQHTGCAAKVWTTACGLELAVVWRHCLLRTMSNPVCIPQPAHTASTR